VVFFSLISASFASESVINAERYLRLSPTMQTCEIIGDSLSFSSIGSGAIILAAGSLEDFLLATADFDLTFFIELAQIAGCKANRL